MSGRRRRSGRLGSLYLLKRAPRHSPVSFPTPLRPRHPPLRTPDFDGRERCPEGSGEGRTGPRAVVVAPTPTPKTLARPLSLTLYPTFSRQGPSHRAGSRGGWTSTTEEPEKGARQSRRVEGPWRKEWSGWGVSSYLRVGRMRIGVKNSNERGGGRTWG